MIALIQAMNQDVIEAINGRYRKKMIISILELLLQLSFTCLQKRGKKLQTRQPKRKDRKMTMKVGRYRQAQLIAK